MSSTFIGLDPQLSILSSKPAQESFLVVLRCSGDLTWLATCKVSTFIHPWLSLQLGKHFYFVFALLSVPFLNANREQISTSCGGKWCCPYFETDACLAIETLSCFTGLLFRIQFVCWHEGHCLYYTRVLFPEDTLIKVLLHWEVVKWLFWELAKNKGQRRKGLHNMWRICFSGSKHCHFQTVLWN